MLLSRYGFLYQRVFGTDASRCFYCGSPRECLDHRPPLSTLDAIGVRAMQRAKIPLFLVPACNDCNLRLSDRPLPTIEEAADYLYRRLDAEYEKRFNLWTDPEISEMSPMFQKMIRARRAQLVTLNSRVRHLQRLLVDNAAFPTWEDYGEL